MRNNAPASASSFKPFFFISVTGSFLFKQNLMLNCLFSSYIVPRFGLISLIIRFLIPAESKMQQPRNGSAR